MTVRTLIVEDEPLARRRLRRLLREIPGFELVGESGDGITAARAIRRLAPDLVLLDVQLPGMDGLAVLEAVGSRLLPAVVFVTAYDRYAVRAFEHHAVDYLLKPVDAERFREALARVRARLRSRAAGALPRRLADLLAASGPDGGRRASERFLVRQRGRSFFVRHEEIDWIEAARNSVRLHVGRAAHPLRATLTAVERRLDPARFRRVSRSALVNLDRVRELQPWFHGDAVIILHSGSRLPLSRRYRDNLVGGAGESL